MRKLLLTFTAMLFCSIASFAQTEISTKEQFLAIQANGNYILTADINLGNLGTLNQAVIPTFSGTLNGNGFAITYQASFSATTSGGLGALAEEAHMSLFGQVSGNITKLNISNTTVTLSGTKNNMNVALLCAYLSSTGTITNCNVMGNVNSTVNPTIGGGSDAGLIVGESEGTVKYCTGSGNVVGVGYVGGLIGQMKSSASVLACSFSGSVNAVSPSATTTVAQGSYAGGICGNASNNSSFQFCHVNANITGIKDAEGITCSFYAGTLGLFGGDVNGGDADVNYCYAEGFINENMIDSDDDIADNDGVDGTKNYYENESIQGCNKTNAECIVDALNNKIPQNEKNNFYFDVMNGKVVLIIGQRATEEAICEAPTGFIVTQEENQPFIISWTPVDDNTYYEESTFILTLSGGELGQSGEITVQNSNYLSTGESLPASEEPYVFTIKTQCEEDVFSESQQVIFYVDPNCTANVNLNNATTTSATINWQGNVSTVKLGDETYTISEGVTEYTFNDLTPATTYSAEVIFNCVKHEGTTEVTYTKTLTIEFTTLASAFITKQTGDFNDANTWQGNIVPKGKIADIKINEGHTVYVNHNLVITGSYKITDNKGVLQITQQGQLINETTTNVPGIIEIVSAPKANQKWTFVGAPFQDDYLLGCILPESHDVSVKTYDYSEANWSDEWAHVETSMEAAEGYFAFPFLDAPITFTTYGDVGTYEDRGNYGYTSTNTVTALNNDTVKVKKSGEWMALSNPYPAKLSINKFLTENNNAGAGIQGGCTYGYNGTSWDIQNATTGDIAMTEGFFVHFTNAGEKTITFNKGQLSYNNQSAKASANEFIKLTLINGDKKVRAYLAHNEEAEQGYDIFDANKMFAPTEIAEPYFVTDGIALMKEEFAELPYYATMNVRSFADDTVSFVVENIPEGLSVSIIDGENIIDMVEGGVYSTEILTGENADRFKVLIKKSVSISDVEELEVNITNNNRHISIETTETDLQVEVYNALGQKVLSTKDRNFTLNQVSAGAYLIKAFNNKASKTQKIVVE